MAVLRENATALRLPRLLVTALLGPIGARVRAGSGTGDEPSFLGPASVNTGYWGIVPGRPDLLKDLQPLALFGAAGVRQQCHNHELPTP